MNETSQKNRFRGRIQNILRDKKAGWIKPDDGAENIYFVALQVDEGKFDTLKQGDLVNFYIGISNDGRRFANKVALANEEDNNTYSVAEIRSKGSVKTILSDKPAGYITANDSSEDLYFVAREVENGKFQTLKPGDAVTFIINDIGNGKRFANKIQLLTNNAADENSSPVSESTPITCEELKRQIIEPFKRILFTTSSSEFEDLIFLLLRTLGIHSLYQYDKRSQAGRADGFFIIGNLAVMYDCTLRQPFEEYKKEQIENYVNKLERDQLTFDIKSSDGGSSKKTLRIAGKSKQVWIITKGKTREIIQVGNIKVKEVSIIELILLLQLRWNTDILEEDELALNQLSRIEKFTLS